ncbi:hypothetical protein ACN2WE_31100 [Streptomyces sp. cg28]|uniref:hypothetical protein n=1 Tax=Streptomyces sp. cg28 TaxID=3403457 RepID=UPI003B21DABB
MTHPIAMSLPYSVEPVYVVAAVGLLAFALVGRSIRRNRTRANRRHVGTPAVWVSAFAALNCTVYSADTSWRFAADYLDTAGTVERAMLFSAGEVALFATALMARQNLKTLGAPGLSGALVWVITGVQIVPAYAESGTVGGTVRAFVGPIMAAVLWHQAMGIEMRLHKPDAASQGLLATLGREARERLLSRLGIATRHRNAAQITKDRATQRAVALAAQLAAMTTAEREKDTRTTRRLQSALARAGVGTDPHQRQALLDQLAARRHAVALATVDLPSPWTQDTLGHEAPHEERPSLVPSAMLLPTELKRADRRLNTPPDDCPQDRKEGASTGTDTDPDRPHTVPETGTDTDPDRPHTVPETGTDTDPDRPHTVPETGTDTHADRPHTVPETGTDTDPDRPHTVPETGTDTDPDRPHTVPGRRRSKTPPNRPGGGKPKGRHPKKLSVAHVVKLVRPHVAAKLERDGNASLNRPQLREIYRDLGLPGGRNESLTPVLERLRAEARRTTR